MNLKNLLFETGYSELESNEDTIADVILGNIESTDPEEVEESEPVSKQLVKDIQNLDLPTPSIEDLSVKIFDDSVNEAKTKKPKVDDPAKIYKQKQLVFFQRLVAEMASGKIYQQTKSKTANFFRIKPKDELRKKLIAKAITPEEFSSTLKQETDRLFAPYNLQKIGPNEPGSGSGTFTTYVLTDTDSTTISIVIAAGGNKGNDFEKKAFMEIDAKKGPVWENLMCFLVSNNKITDLSQIDRIEHPGLGKVSRPFANSMDDVGSKISDVTIFLKDRSPIYVSLKDAAGKTFANTGYSQAFEVNKNEETGVYEVNAREVPGSNTASKNIEDFLSLLGVDKQKMAEGFQDYINGLADIPVDTTDVKQLTDLIDESSGNRAVEYLSYQLGFGYIYFRRMSSGGFRILDLENGDATAKVFGKFVSGEIRYPYFIGKGKQSSSRQFTATINTTKAKYTVEIRFTGRVQKPEDVIKALQCNVRVEKLVDSTTYQCKENWRDKLKIQSELETDRERLISRTLDEKFTLSRFLF